MAWLSSHSVPSQLGMSLCVRHHHALCRWSLTAPAQVTRGAVVAPEHSCSLLSPQATACTEQICMGSVMTPSPHIRKSEDTRTKEEVLLLAKDFIDQYYSSIKR